MVLMIEKLIMKKQSVRKSEDLKILNDARDFEDLEVQGISFSSVQEMQCMLQHETQHVMI